MTKAVMKGKYNPTMVCFMKIKVFEKNCMANLTTITHGKDFSYWLLSEKNELMWGSIFRMCLILFNKHFDTRF